MNVKQINTTALAYMGDSVYEVFVRRHLLESGQTNADRLHGNAVRFVRAEGQALALRTLMEELTTEEQALARRAKNRKITSKPQNVDPITYKFATAFEALIGYLYLNGDDMRLAWFMEQSVKVIEGSKENYVKR